MTTRSGGRRSRRGGGRGFRSGRKTQWVDTFLNELLVPGANAAVSLLSDLVGNDTMGMTLTRTIISITIAPTAWSGTLGTARCDMGIGLATQEAFLAGVLPDPAVATEEPILGWAWREKLVQVTPGSVSAGIQPARTQADVKSRRKIDDGELYIAMDNITVNGAGHDMLFVGLIRTLYLLP